jgi:hypothetical protein
MTTLQQIESMLLSAFQQADRSDDMAPSQAAALAARNLWSMVPEFHSASDASDTIKAMQARIERKDRDLCDLGMMIEHKQLEIDRLKSMLLERSASPSAMRERALIERCAKVADDYAVPNRFSVSDAWKEHSPAEVYATAAVDVGGWIATEIRALSPDAGVGLPNREADDDTRRRMISVIAQW